MWLDVLSDFVPKTNTLLGLEPTGNWIDVLSSTKPEWLEKLEPEVIKACRERRLGIMVSNAGLPKGSH